MRQIFIGKKETLGLSKERDKEIRQSRIREKERDKLSGPLPHKYIEAREIKSYMMDRIGSHALERTQS